MGRGWKVMAIALVAILAAGIIVGIVFAVMAAFPGKPKARIISLTLAREDGKALNPKKVPLDTDLVLTATYDASYPADGRGTLKLWVESSSGEELIGDTFEVKSSGLTQKKEYIVNMTAGSGKPVKAKARLTVTSGGKKTTEEKYITYTAEKGSVKDENTTDASDLETARDNVKTDYNKLVTTVQVANSAGVDISDVKDQIADIGVKIPEATTVEELDSLSEAPAAARVVVHPHLVADPLHVELVDERPLPAVAAGRHDRLVEDLLPG
jgi:hypothetical protein